MSVASAQGLAGSQSQSKLAQPATTEPAFFYAIAIAIAKASRMMNESLVEVCYPHANKVAKPR